MEILKKKKNLEVKNVSEMKNLLGEIKSWLDTTEKSEFKTRIMKIIQSETHRLKKC